MQQRVETPFVPWRSAAEDDTGPPRNAAGGIHLAGIGKLLQCIEEQQDDLALRRDGWRLCGGVKSEVVELSRHPPNPRYSLATVLIIFGVQGGS